MLLENICSVYGVPAIPALLLVLALGCFGLMRPELVWQTSVWAQGPTPTPVPMSELVPCDQAHGLPRGSVMIRSEANFTGDCRIALPFTGAQIVWVQPAPWPVRSLVIIPRWNGQGLEVWLFDADGRNMGFASGSERDIAGRFGQPAITLIGIPRWNRLLLPYASSPRYP
ncbi:hypothetical protein A3C23_02450 [Candidatus Roizmanbacteria bacterium RIFCSPHIGHO2_02_FULL_37_13b]|uniref:Uncharacterized protein n=1 Tax=Candidatus Roizmanbacteria bacterium RIFCSPLOWO2_02_FULL_36_11 TaxID=1802071 RepID=A0A1F7JIQ6_9BACT|nr:MAG: hypothetical protein A3C23_02450 [Candidatus Roizmanbacteria bacterium RIFCSPHIGHO2_02_FULL_37_13b]OGK55495.1 MAG: hypothetical protein A3H78_04995 [Candidatus Roizmanbacteria bacterium RIFCSPLOWO2_02_FULL_36_11]